MAVASAIAIVDANVERPILDRFSTKNPLIKWRTGRDCGKHAWRMFSVLGLPPSNRSLRSRPKSAVADFVEQGSVIPIPGRQIKKAPQGGLFNLADREAAPL
jgi:hypothetical protein